MIHIAHEAGRFAAWVLNNPWTVGIMSWCLLFVPILGMWTVHKYGWEHWEPFAKHEPHTETTRESE